MTDVSTALFSCGGDDDDEPGNPDTPAIYPGQPDDTEHPDNPGGSEDDHNTDLPGLAAQFENIYSPLFQRRVSWLTVISSKNLMPGSFVGMYNNQRYALTEHCCYLIDDDRVMMVYWRNKDKGFVNAI